jgi:hypothetical protein
LNLAHSVRIDRFTQFFFLLVAEFDQMIDELSFSSRFLRDFKAPQRGRLDVKVAHFTRALTDATEELQEFPLAAGNFRRKFAEKDLKAPGARTKAMDAFRLRFRGKLDYVPFKLLKNRMTALCGDRHKRSESEENTGLLAKRQSEKLLHFNTLLTGFCYGSGDGQRRPTSA